MLDERIEAVLEDIKTSDDLREMFDDIIAGDCSGFGETGILYPIGMRQVHGTDAPRHVEFQSPMGTIAMEYPEFKEFLLRQVRDLAAYHTSMDEHLKRTCTAIDSW